jgi:flagellar biosynthesis GTPase FlhF
VSLDAVKIGAYDEIHSYGELLGAEVSDAFQCGTGTDSDSDKIVFIDTPALPRDRERFQALQKRVRELNPSHCLATFSSLTRSSDVATSFDEMGPLEPSHLVMTMLDATSRHGSLVAAGVASGLRLTFVTDAPGGVGVIKPPDPNHLAKAILRPEPIPTSTRRKRINQTPETADIRG